MSSAGPAESAVPPSDAAPVRQDFIRQIVREDLASGKHSSVRTRFPPEPNGYLHIGHAKAICLDFGIAAEFDGRCNLRFDDTNPEKEDLEFVRAIEDDVRWLGFEWSELRHASDYFDVYYRAATKLIEQGDAFVCDLTAEQVREYRGTLIEPGRNSPFRDRSVEENLDLFARMRAGEFADGTRTLRAKIDMSSGNINLRDPALYRIKQVAHQNTGDAWPIYPMYDFAHALGDAVEGITHSLCTLEFEDHRPLYDWVVDRVDLAGNPDLLASLSERGLPVVAAKPRQIEFSRLNINYTVMSKRKLTQLVADGLVDGWDDPRMYTLQGLRRRGYTPASLRLLVDRVGISKQNSVIDFSVLEGALRDDLDARAPRRMAVIDPLKLVLTNLPDGHAETLTFPNHPKDETQGTREVPFSRQLWIERDDFAEVPPKGWKRLVPGGEVRLRGAGIVRVDEVVKDADGRIVELQGTLDPESRPGMEGANRKVKGTIHWVSAAHAVETEVRLFDRLFVVEKPDDESTGKTYRDHLNPDSKRSVTGYIEPAAAEAAPEQSFQFERTGYFVADRVDHTSTRPVFNRSVTLRDTWAAGNAAGLKVRTRPTSDKATIGRMRTRFRRLLSVVAAVALLALVACAAPATSAPGAATPTPEQAGTPLPANALQPDRSCKVDADCAVRNVGSCCGYQPACVNANAQVDPQAVQADCAARGVAGVCGFVEIQSCACVNARCEAPAAGAVTH